MASLLRFHLPPPPRPSSPSCSELLPPFWLSGGCKQCPYSLGGWDLAERGRPGCRGEGRREAEKRARLSWASHPAVVKGSLWGTLALCSSWFPTGMRAVRSCGLSTCPPIVPKPAAGFSPVYCELTSYKCPRGQCAEMCSCWGNSPEGCTALIRHQRSCMGFIYPMKTVRLFTALSLV